MKFSNAILFLVISTVMEFTVFEFGSAIPVDTTTADPKAASNSSAPTPAPTAVKNETIEGRVGGSAVSEKPQNTTEQNNATKPDGAGTTVKNETLQERALPNSTPESTKSVQNNQTAVSTDVGVVSSPAPTAAKDDKLQARAALNPPSPTATTETKVENTVKNETAESNSTASTSPKPLFVAANGGETKAIELQARDLAASNSSAPTPVPTAVKNETIEGRALPNSTPEPTKSVQNNQTAVSTDVGVVSSPAPTAAKDDKLQARAASNSSAPTPATAAANNETVEGRALSSSSSTSKTVVNTQTVTSVLHPVGDTKSAAVVAKALDNAVSNSVPSDVAPVLASVNNTVQQTLETGNLNNGGFSSENQFNLGFSSAPIQTDASLQAQKIASPGTQVIDALKVANSVVGEANHEHLNVLERSVGNLENYFSNQEIQLPFK